jgi:hypothetical protein
MTKKAGRLVHLKVIVGKPSYDEHGSIQNENMVVRIEHGGKNSQWYNYMKNLKSQGFGKVSIQKVTEFGKDDVEIDQYDDIKDELALAIAKPDEALTEDQKRIKELEGKVRELLNAKSTPKKATQEVDPELKSLREEYMELNGGKKGSPKWDAETLRVKIEELINS